MRKGILVVIIGIIISTMMPFSIYADDYTGSTIQGFNVSLIDVEQTLVNSGGTSGYMSKYIYEVEFILDDSYIGYINISGEIKFYPYNSSTLTTYNLPGRNYFVNGTSFKLTFQLTGDGYTVDNRPSLNNTVFIYGNHNLYKHSELESLDQIITILGNIYNSVDGIEGLETNQLSVLNSILTKCSSVDNRLIDTNTYLNIISQIKQWNIPFESIAPTISMLKNGFEIYEVRQYNNFQFPIFIVHPNDVIYRFASAPISVSDRYDDYNVIILWNKAPSDSAMNTNMKLVDGTWSDARNRLYEWYDGTYNWCITKFKLNDFTTSSVYNSITNKYNTDIYISIIYFGPNESEQLLSTDFALNFGMTNKLLNDLNIIANGTSQSQSAASGLEQQNTQMASDMNSLATIESGYNQDFNSQMQNIDFSNPITSNQGLLPAANFVITVFNGLINNNPLSVLIIICCILLIGRKVIGK